jgi:hypothetical protein
MPVEDADGVWMALEVFAALDFADFADFVPSRVFLEKNRVPVAANALPFCERKQGFDWISASSLT